MLSFLNLGGPEGSGSKESSPSRANGSSLNGGSKGALGNAASPEGQLASCLRDAATGDGSCLRSKLESLRPRLEESIDQPSTGTPDPLEQDDLCSAVIAYVQGDTFGTAEDPVCQWMFEWYQTGKPGRQRFVARFLPEMATAFLLQQQRSPRLLGLQAVMIAVYEAEVQGRAPSAAVPQLELPSSYHTPPTRASSADQGASRTNAPDSLPPGIAALLAGADPSPALTTMLMPKTIDGNVRAWQSTEVAASAISEFRSHMATYRTEALESASRCCLGLAAHSCPWALELAKEVAGTEGLGGASAVLPGLSDSAEEPVAGAVGEAKQDEKQQGAAASSGASSGPPGLRVPMEGRLLEQLCLVLGHCRYRAAGEAGVLAGPSDTPAKNSELLRLVRASALVLHARAVADADSAALIATSALVKSLEDNAAARQ